MKDEEKVDVEMKVVEEDSGWNVFEWEIRFTISASIKFSDS